MASGDRGAEILFFTGVRYQRMSEEPPAPERQARRARGKRQAAEVCRKSQR